MTDFPLSRSRQWSENADSIRHLQPGEILFWEGDRCQWIGMVISGRICIRSLHLEGEEYLIQTIEPNQFFGDVMTFADAPCYLGQVVAEEATTVAFFSPMRFLTILKTIDGLLEDYLRAVSHKAYELKQELKLRSVPGLRERILFFLRSEALRQGKETIDVGVSREALALRLGVARPSLSRELSSLQKDGVLIVRGKRIQIEK
ncbi:MAG TPA: Crp/Fnr family transcriptional regulator [Candidatus Izemoplasmatales bacterium]|nr:Crp/Fnr family transcriptional regulator [Bacillota bacterium]HRY77296.1 Crp/Fnr family transcriptional regulator [Candidatus Izemoplasmatales bacterium]